jgi:hypothetical protein
VPDVQISHPLRGIFTSLGNLAVDRARSAMTANHPG